MLKRILPIILCITLAVGMFSVTASAEDKTHVTGGDVKLYVDKENIAKGDFVTVSIYLEDITVAAGIIAVDFPLMYDRSKLAFIKYECIFPEEWDDYGDFFGHSTPDEEPWYLRSLPDAPDLTENEAYRITASKKIGFEITFKTVAEGEAYVAVEVVGNNKIMIATIEGEQINNYGARGMTLKFDIGGENSSSDVTEPSQDVSVDVSQDSSVDSSDDSSEDISTDISDVVSEDDSSEEESVAESSAADETSEDSSVVAGVESSEADTADSSEENSKTEDGNKKDEDKGGLSDFIVPAIIVVAVAALAGVGAFLFVKKKSATAENESEGE